MRILWHRKYRRLLDSMVIKPLLKFLKGEKVNQFTSVSRSFWLRSLLRRIMLRIFTAFCLVTETGWMRARRELGRHQRTSSVTWRRFTIFTVR